MTVEAKVRREAVLPRMLKARYSTSCEVSHWMWKIYFTWCRFLPLLFCFRECDFSLFIKKPLWDGGGLPVHGPLNLILCAFETSI